MTDPDDGKPKDEGKGGEQVTLAELKARQDATDSKLDTILGILGKGKEDFKEGAGKGTEANLGRPSTVEEQVAAALRQREDQEKKEKAAEGDKKWRESVESRLEAVKESPPEVARPIEKFMGWR